MGGGRKNERSHPGDQFLDLICPEWITEKQGEGDAESWQGKVMAALFCSRVLARCSTNSHPKPLPMSVFTSGQHNQCIPTLSPHHKYVPLAKGQSKLEFRINSPYFYVLLQSNNNTSILCTRYLLIATKPSKQGRRNNQGVLLHLILLLHHSYLYRPATDFLGLPSMADRYTANTEQTLAHSQVFLCLTRVLLFYLSPHLCSKTKDYSSDGWAIVKGRRTK